MAQSCPASILDSKSSVSVVQNCALYAVSGTGSRPLSERNGSFTLLHGILTESALGPF